MQSNAAAAAAAGGNKRPFKIIRSRARAKLAELVIIDFAGNSGGRVGIKGGDLGMQPSNGIGCDVFRVISAY